jgi:hypothetical protein
MPKHFEPFGPYGHAPEEREHESERELYRDDDDPRFWRPWAHCPPPAPGGLPDIELYDLIDFQMQVGNTGIVFVAAITGWRESDGTALFIPGATAAAYRRAASTLAAMSLVAGSTFQFMRLAQNLSVDQAAILCGVDDATVNAWEAGTTPVPFSSWQYMADAACKADSRPGIVYTAPQGVDLRPRVIRVYPDVPGLPLPPQPPANCDPCDDDDDR